MKDPEPIVEAARTALEQQLSITNREPNPTSHRCAIVSDFDDDEQVEALGIYLTGLIAQLVKVDLEVSAWLFGENPAAIETLRANVDRTVGASNELSDFERVYRRDPWIAEAIGHLLIGAARNGPTECLDGRLHALSLLHMVVSEQGLDLIGVYECDNGSVGLSITEAKASESNGQAQLQRAVELFQALDDRKRDLDLLQALNSFQAYIPQDLLDRVAAAVWTDTRSYSPCIAFSDGFNPESDRPLTLGRLRPPRSDRRLISVELSSYRRFFDDVADAMRRAVGEFSP
jgi:hypothetical protein